MVYTIGLLVSCLIWVIKGNGSMKSSYNQGRNDFLSMVKEEKGEDNANSK